MDSFELNKIAGGVLGVLTFTLGLNVFADILFSQHAPEKPGFEIAVVESGGGAAQAAAPADVPIAQLLGAANAERGAAVAKKCAACHNFVEGAGAKVGPDLYGIVGRPVASAEGFAYSAAMKGHGGTWTFQDLSDFIKNPKADIPGTAMGFAGIAKETERADLLVYLNSLSHSPQPLPAADAPAAAPAPATPAPASGEPAGSAPAPAPATP
ncbi:c-type cytochrome [Ancylobacter terrae]|uniref:c-type cytochrome n=1 Tax=Ancylobacter sp. sgz301288 TaxID=3342077 RepID=UPI00385ED954